MVKRPIRPLRLVAVLFTASCIGQVPDAPETPGSAPTTTGTTGTKSNPQTPGTGTTSTSTPDNGAPAPLAYEALSPRAYGSKVKDILTGLPLSNDELAVLNADKTANHAALRKLIDTWMALPQFKEKMFDFYQNAFQQTQIDPSDLDDQLKLASSGIDGTLQKKMLKNVTESFARTVLALVDEGRPFTDVVTTNRFMMTVPMMMALSYMDAAPMNDTGQGVTQAYWLVDKFGGAKAIKYQQVLTPDPTTGADVVIPFEDSINPSSPNFMTFTFRQVPMPTNGGMYKPCAQTMMAMGTNTINDMYRALFGNRQQVCNGAPNEAAVFTDADWNTWKMVTIRQPKAGEDRTVFWDVPKLRTGSEIVVSTPRVGFMTTLAFFANWPTNTSNQYRVTTNQALIVGLGKSFDDKNTTVQVSETSVDALHVQPGTVCYGCHVTLDPMRDFFKQSYSITYFQQLSMLNPKNPPLPMKGTFSVPGGTPTDGVGIGAFAQAMASHPFFASAWTQKLCRYANAEVCTEDDPEFQRVATVFKNSKFDFKTLVRELFSSPLVTYASKTKTADTAGVALSITRREALCSRIGSRLGFHDACNWAAESTVPKVANQLKSLSLGVPGSSYNRADENPMTPHDPNLFFVSGTEKMCIALAGVLVEGGTTSVWKVAAKDQAISDFVTTIMGVPANDPMAPQLIDILNRHYAAAIASKDPATNRNETPASALQSTFTLACSSPLAVSVGL